jgi:predicted nucleotidyltransferase
MGVMAKALNDVPDLRRFRQAVAEIYGDRVERVVLFGSRARGDAQADSDYDIAVFMRQLSDRATAMNQLADLGTDILYDGGPVIHALPFPAGAYRQRTALMQEIRRDGVDL